MTNPLFGTRKVRKLDAKQENTVTTPTNLQSVLQKISDNYSVYQDIVTRVQTKQFEAQWEDQLVKVKTHCSFLWFNEDGVLHRDDGPACDYFDGGEEWFTNGARNRISGLPAVTKKSKKEWYENDLLHRYGAPAIQYDNGDYEHFVQGKRHREHGPAVKRGTREEWWLHDQRHRIGDGPSVVDGQRQEWYERDKRHRVGKPAIIDGDREEWYENDLRHRNNGPAVVEKRSKEYWVRGNFCANRKQFKDRVYMYNRLKRPWRYQNRGK